MAVLRMQVSKLLFILFVIGFIANDVNGDCPRPVFTNPYAITFDPDQQAYLPYYPVVFDCEEGHTPNGLPDYYYCQEDSTWDRDISDGRCYAQCNTTKLISDDDVKVTDDSGVQQTVFNHGENANFACTNKSQSSGSEQGTCNNGTLTIQDEPSCLVYCPVYLNDLGEGLFYDIADPPVINETNTLYYEDGKEITYRCSDGYEGPQNRTPSDDGTTTCNDGSWDPPGIPTCMDIDECSDSPCLNNGNCTDLINGYQCQCADGFNGTNCGNNIDDCASHECENGATCVDDIASYECQCPDGFNGIYCENVMTTAEMVTTMELPTSMEMTTIADQSTIALTTTKASTTEGLPTSLPNSTPPSTPMTPTDSSTTSVVTPGLTTVNPDATTATPAISTETAPPTVPESTTKSDSTTSSNPTSSTPEKTEKPPTTPLPCGVECKATQLCNDNNCECRPDYYEDEDEEDPENPCKEPESIDVTIKITKVNNTNAEYKVELEDPESPEFKKLESDVCKPFEEIYKSDTEYKGCRVLEFSNGSIIVNYVLTFAENSNQSASTVNTTVQEELQNPNGSFTGAYEFDDSSLVVAPLDECTKKIDTCDPDNANCIDQGADGYTCECHEGFEDVGIPKSLPGRECMKPTDPRTTEEPQEPGLEPWKVVVGVTVPIISILTITIVGLTCWQYRRLHRTSPKSAMTKMRTFPYDDDTRGSSDRGASRPESMMIMNNDGTVQEVVLPWRNIPAEEEFIFAPDNGKGRTQMLPTVDYPSDYAGSASYDNDPLGNIVGSYDNYTYQHHDMTNSTEIDSKYF